MGSWAVGEKTMEGSSLEDHLRDHQTAYISDVVEVGVVSGGDPNKAVVQIHDEHQPDVNAENEFLIVLDGRYPVGFTQIERNEQLVG